MFADNTRMNNLSSAHTNGVRPLQPVLVFDNVCQHRGSKLKQGCCNLTEFERRFHGWYTA